MRACRLFRRIPKWSARRQRPPFHLPTFERGRQRCRPHRRQRLESGRPCSTRRRLITSQIDTAPKQLHHVLGGELRLITSQIDTAPKLQVDRPQLVHRLITSQIDTAPKPRPHRHRVRGRLITSQIDTAPKRRGRLPSSPPSLITSQIDTAPKRAGVQGVVDRAFDYQSDRHCSKTESRTCTPPSLFDYQSDRHCSKTHGDSRL